MSPEHIRIASNGASDSEAAAIVAAVEQFLADTAPPPTEEAPATSPWARAALREGIAARQLYGDAWGHAPPPR
ncbi:MAG: hypothetical protein M3Y34_06310 [Actinomycetota bacterium]|nr:hypothetical protein [Actinomycetota bacterium]